MQYTIKLPNLHATKEFAKLISQSINPNFVITLKGDLGAGKTTLVREVLYHLGVVGSVKSPTYTLVEPYIANDIQINHFDLYRFNDPDEWIESGFDEYFSSNCICFIEWPEKADSYLPQVDWKLQITVDDETRSIEINPQSDKGRQCLMQLTKIAAR
jgi:tRNA threonylcarbamoyladenosine biosynthesis protein TsaE